jgi:hypothetical protein
MGRVPTALLALCSLLGGVAAAQDAAPNQALDAAPDSTAKAGPSALAALEQTVRQKTAGWEKLTQGLDASIRHLLPCDPKAAAAITELSKASDARTAALSAYLQEAARQTALLTEAARRMLAALQPLATEFSAEKSDLMQEQLGILGQIAVLADTAAGGGQHRASFDGAQDALRQIGALEQQRSDTVDSGISHDDATWQAVRGLLAQLEEREAALKETQAAFETERARWSAYYAARLLRAQTECNVTKGGAAAPAQPQGKQK